MTTQPTANEELLQAVKLMPELKNIDIAELIEEVILVIQKYNHDLSR
ncbi:hypothetical protein [Paenibacillus mucilaginosus]|uniref:Uncharacterized protein n=1 Tax=Paenibacillus mucilaginosus (strain KNP414) TaxID=1036673 RepID=F8FF58_PAEMK|nr:hypothetical protein [Paenibacillus mucilaginosus]AEI39758.1 hypothetical protein KNP414_01191 [Paenibacillus mucilaginosus KNP414]MCG7217386.1 hypothetical protein [Paenibacillus mucilaginosus]WDM29044.1 hypothetical protein KCX80_07715 [Paenibacillus mucilaginosus]